MFCYQSLPSQNHIRLVVLAPKRLSPKDDLEVSIIACDLTIAPPYEALSYVWGDSRDTIRITVNQKWMHIGRSLHTALTELQNVEAPRTLWVDALCINQQDNAEKFHQILRMREIYANAWLTIMWIEPKTPSDIERAKILQHLHKKAPSYKKWPDTYVPIENSTSSAMDWLLQQTYFSRSWITQEILVSQNPVITCGPVKISFDTLIDAFIAFIGYQERSMKNAGRLMQLGRWRSLLKDKDGISEKDAEPEDEGQSSDEKRRENGSVNMSKAQIQRDNTDESDGEVRSEHGCMCNCRVRFAPCDFFRALYMALIKEVFKYKHRCHRIVKGSCKDCELSLQNLLTNLRDRDASNPCDKVYALLGVVRPTLELRFVPDCSRPTMELQILPDSFNDVKEIYRSVALQFIYRYGVNILSYSQPAHSDLDMPSWIPDWSQRWHGGISLRANFHAGTALESLLSVCKCFENIGAKGLQVGTIQKIGGTSLKEWKKFSDFWLPFRYINSEIAANLTGLGLQGDYPYTGEDYKFAFLEVITAGYGVEVLEKDFSKYSVPSVGIDDYARNTFDPIAMRWRDLFANLAWSDGEWEIFQSDQGYLGLGPTSMEVGDSICIFAEAKVPFILRKEWRGYNLVGECYVHGMMQGEMVKGLSVDQLEEFIIW